MSLGVRLSLVAGVFLGLGLGPVGIGQAQEAEPTTSRVELMLVQENGRVTAFSLSTGTGVYVETRGVPSTNIGVAIGTSIATGVIASADPVASTTREDGFDLFTSDVGTLILEVNDLPDD